MIWGIELEVIAYYCGLHFGLGFLVGLAVFWLTLTTGLGIKGLHTHMICGQLDQSIFRWLSLLVVSSSIVVHVLEDWLLRWF